MTQPLASPSLADLRTEIDRIDAAMHLLLMERSEIIDRLVQVKRTQGAEGGSAFRPAREADMMRRLVERHHGLLPLDTVESIWRVIIATFTYVQAPYSVHADLAVGEPAMRDSARFHFGFTVPFVPHMGANGVIEAVAASKGDLGLLPAAVGTTPWWIALEADGAPKIIARLPFVERDDHPAALPVFVVSHPISDAAVTEVRVHSVRVSGWSAAAGHSLPAFAEILVAPDEALDGAALLVSVPPGHRIDEVLDAVTGAGAGIRSAREVGSHAALHKVCS
ncbi:MULTISPECIES: chorismate mutase [Xanthobacter]|uniref:chorismate mutase n=1 Tax=Xanthobacter TaxID=279 RepID=UPI001F2969E4|nr:MULTISPECIES: chorismate mutase [unclassified Xanthobacter]